MKFAAALGAVLFCWVSVSPVGAVDSDFDRYSAQFKNFITCELTRTDATNHFSGSPFTITMVKLHGIQDESGLKILTGAVQCFVKNKYHTLYVNIGVETLEGREMVGYYTIGKGNVSLLATALFKFPYEERCPWVRYWIDTD